MTKLRPLLVLAVLVVAPLLGIALWPVGVPPTAQLVATAEQRYGPQDLARWHRNALDPHAWPIDVSFLNDGERPAGKRGFIRAQGDQLVFEDGTPARFWGTNVAAGALFLSNPEIELHARRIAALGYNLVRIHHHDSTGWVDPTVIDKKQPHSQGLDARGMDRLDYWIKCLKDQGVYVWLDLHVARKFTRADAIGGFEDIEKKQHGEVKGFCYINARVQELMQDFNERYLTHVNTYTGAAYKDEPAIVGVLLTNENDLTHHFGNLMLPDKGAAYHQKLFDGLVREFSQSTGLSARELGRTWQPGAGKILLSELEHRFNAAMMAHLRQIGVRVPIATTNMFGGMPGYSLAALSEGDVIDVHAYDGEEVLSRNPRVQANFIDWMAGAQIANKPLTVSEWNLPRNVTDRFIGPMYVMSIASLQGFDALMHYNYTQEPVARFHSVRHPSEWSTYQDPAMTALMPAAAVAFRQQHVQPAQQAYVLRLTPDQLFNQRISPESSAAMRTLAERSRLLIALPPVKELPWLAPGAIPAGTQVISDPDERFIAADATLVRSDTGELTRDWMRGVQTIDTPRTVAAAGWMESHPIALTGARFALANPKASVAVTSLDNKPIGESQRMLVTAIARVTPGPEHEPPYYSEPIAGEITVRCTTPGLVFIPLASNGTHLPAIAAKPSEEGYTLSLPAENGTHWFLLSRPDDGR